MTAEAYSVAKALPRKIPSELYFDNPLGPAFKQAHLPVASIGNSFNEEDYSLQNLKLLNKLSVH